MEAAQHCYRKHKELLQYTNRINSSHNSAEQSATCPGLPILHTQLVHVLPVPTELQKVQQLCECATDEAELLRAIQAKQEVLIPIFTQSIQLIEINGLEK